MSESYLNPNFWYQVLNVGANYWLSFVNADNGTSVMAIDPSPEWWQFLDPATIGQDSHSGTYLMRPTGFPDYCVDILGGSAVLIPCTPNTVLWTVTYQNFGGDDYEWSIYNSDFGYLAAQGPGSADLEWSSTIPQGTDQANAEYGITSATVINDPRYSFFPSFTSAPVATTTMDSPTSTTDSVTSPDTTSTPLTTDPSTTTVSATSSGIAPTGTYFSKSHINENLSDLSKTLTSLILPPHSDVGCRNCTMSGYADFSSGGCDMSDDSYTALLGCIESGYVDLSVNNINTNASLDVELLPGFQPVNTFLAFYNVSIGRVNVTNLLTLNFDLEIGIPFIISLLTPVTFTGGFVLDIPQAHIRLDLGDISSSTISGFENSQIQALPFGVSAPDIGFNVTTGLALRMHMTALSHVSKVDVGGVLTFELGMPQTNLTAQVESNVDDNCNPASGSSSHAHAIKMGYDVEGTVSARGDLTIASKTFNSTRFPPFYYPIDSNSQCLYDDRLSARFMANTRSGSAATDNYHLPWWMLLCGLLVNVLF